MAELKTIVKDIYSLFDPKTTSVPKQEDLDIFGENIKKKVIEKLQEVTKSPTLRMSNLGTPCARQLWYQINRPGTGEGLRPWTYIKFLFGDIIEELLLLLAKTSGHVVKDEQRVLDVGGVKGRCDGTIDDVLVDVKSASSRGFDKFERGLRKDDDSFGYLTQLGLYNHASGDSKRPAAFLALDKQNGTIALDVHTDLGDIDYEALVEERKTIVAAGSPPARGFSDKAHGESGNRQLGLNCSYCSFRNTCWPGLRTFLYSRGPVFLTKVERIPDVPEAK